VPTPDAVCGVEVNLLTLRGIPVADLKSILTADTKPREWRYPPAPGESPRR